MPITAEQMKANEEHFRHYMRSTKLYMWINQAESYDMTGEKRIGGIKPHTPRGFIALGKIVSRPFMERYVELPDRADRHLWELLYPPTHFKCCLCKKRSAGYGNSAEPEANGRCCDDCNYERVIPSRMADAQLKQMARINSRLGELAKEEDTAKVLRRTLAWTIAEGLKEGCNTFSISTPEGVIPDMVVPPRSEAEFAPNKLKTPPPPSDKELAKMFAKEDLTGQKRGKSKKEREAEAKAEATRLANLEREEERKRKREFEKEVARKEALKTKTAKK